MEQIKIIIDKILHTQILNSIIIVLVSIVLYKLVSYIITKGTQNSNFKVFENKKTKTYIKMLKSIIRYVFIVLTVLILLQINGVNVSSLLAGIGILSVIIGLAIQDALKDIIRGTSILSDNYFSVGDVIEFGQMEGKVIFIGLKTTKIELLKNGNIVSIANRNIEQVQVVSTNIYIDLPMPYELNVETSEKVINDITNSIKKNNNVIDCTYKGVNELADSSIRYMILVNAKPDFKLQVRRDALRSILIVLDKNNISVPYTQIDIHTK